MFPLLTDYLMQFLDCEDSRVKIDKDFKIKKLIEEKREEMERHY